MFSFGKKSTEVAPDTILPSAPKAEPWGEIYTMPKVAAGVSAQPVVTAPAAGKNRRLLIVLLVSLLVAIGGVGSYLAFFRAAPGDKPSDLQPITEPVVTPNTNQPTVPVTPPAPTTTPAERDRIRYGDISTLQSMLKLYAADNGGKYPFSPLPLILGGDSSKTFSSAGFASQLQGTTYLTVVPQNPIPNGADYLYESTDGITYSLSFRLEEGAGGLNPGDHQATPQGIDVASLPTTPVTSGTPRQITPPPPSVDTDSDGLTDAEELLFGTDPQKIDTDADTYADGAEVTAGFDPTQVSGARLDQSNSLSLYTSTRFGYSLYHPKAWLARATDKEGTEVVFTGTEASEFIEVLVVDNPEKLSAPVWYAKQVTGLTPEEVPTVTVGNITWAMSLDGLNAYTTTDRYLITLSYNIGTRTQASYYTLFKTMLQMFVLSTPIENPAAGAGAFSPVTNRNSSNTNSAG